MRAIPELSKNEAAALTAWRDTCEEDNVLSFAVVAQRSALAERKVRRFVRALARKGFVKFCRMSWNDEGPRGAGYFPTNVGYAAISQMGEPS